MFNFLSSCGFCSNIPKGGDYAYETFSKVPTVGGIFGNLSQKIRPISGLVNHIAGLTSLAGSHQKGSLDLGKFLNNVPAQSLIAGESTFKDLADNNSNGIIKKVLKSNYNELIKEHT